MPIKRLDEFFDIDPLTYSGGDVTKMPIIGKAITHPIGPFPEAEYDIVEIIYGRDDKPIYVANMWYKDYKRIPQILHSDLVKEYIPLENTETSR